MITMQYAVNKAKSAEYLRLAIEKMARQDTAFHPVSYAVWYEYVSGEHQKLAEAVDALLAEQSRLNEEHTSHIFNTYIAEVDAAGAQTVVDRFSKVMTDLGETTTQACTDSAHFSQVIKEWSLQMDQASSSPTVNWAPLREQSQLMQQSMTQLQATLSSTTQEIQRLQEEITRARHASQQDRLTGLMSRAGFESALSQALIRQATPEADSAQTCLIKIDIDHFRRLNDTHGHLFGDKVIYSVAQLLQGHCAERDAVARYEGNQFIVLMPETPLEIAEKKAESIRSEVAALRLKHPVHQSQVSDLSISLGLATYRAGEDAESLVDRANLALSASKTKGRNQLTIVK